MSLGEASWVRRFLRLLAGWIYAYPRVFFYPQVFLLVGSIYYTVEHLEFSTSRNDLVGREKRYHQNFLRFKEDFAVQDDMVAVVESEDFEKNRQFVERLGSRLEAETRLFRHVLYVNDVKMLGRKALQFFPEENLVALRTTLRDYRPFIGHFASASNLNSLFRLVNQQFRAARPEADASTQSLLKALPALERILRQAEDSLRRPGMPPSPGIAALFDATAEAERSQYITFAEGRIYLVTVRAQHESLNAPAVARFRELVRQTQSEVPGVNVGVTGESVLELDEMAQSKRDTLVASVAAFILVALIFVYGYQETGRPVKAAVCLMVGLAYTMAYTTLVVGHLNILTITFAPMLIGLAIDFGVHLVTRYEEELRQNHEERLALEKAMVYSGQGIFTGCLTTSAAFFAMSLTSFRGIQEMGVICGGGLLLTLVPMMTLLPVLLLRGRQNLIDHRTLAVADPRARIERLWLDRPRAVLAGTLVAAVLALTQVGKVRFDYNLLNMQSAGLPAVVFEHKLIQSATKSVLYAAVVAGSLDAAVQLQARLERLPSVGSVDSLAPFLTADPAPKLALIEDIKQELAAVAFAEPDEEPVDVRGLSQTLQFFQVYLSLAIREVEKQPDAALLAQLRSVREAVGGLRWEMSNAKPSHGANKLGAFQRALFQDIRLTFEAIRQQDNGSGLQADDLPPALRDRFIGKDGKVLLQVYPRADVWQRENQAVFVQELRTVDPDVTGTPVQLYEYTSLLVNSYLEAAGFALLAIAVMVFVHFRQISAVFLALLPVGLGVLWGVGLMGWTGVPFNPANIMTAPLVVGIGVTNGIHILNRFKEDRSPRVFAKSTGKAVLISGLTTIVGFGSLLLAEHQGIASLGFLMATGTATCMVAGLTSLPAVLNLRKKQPSD
jgi:hypothetical protein